MFKQYFILVLCFAVFGCGIESLREDAQSSQLDEKEIVLRDKTLNKSHKTGNSCGCDEDFIADKPFDFETCHKTFFVSASAYALEANGSIDAPFSTIQEALDVINETPVSIHVAAGQYRGNFDLSPGIHLFGGFDPKTWQKEEGSTSVIQNEEGSVTLLGTSDEVSVIDGFEIRGCRRSKNPTVVQRLGSKSILKNNTIYVSLMEENEACEDGVAVRSREAQLRFTNNKILVPSDTPEEFYTKGIILRTSCAIVADNIIESVRTPITINWGAKVKVIENEIYGGSNGISIEESSPVIEKNVISLKESKTGAWTYAVYISGSSNPVIHDNEFHIGGSTKGINESGSLNSDPHELTDNHFVLSSSTALYMDADGPREEGQHNYNIFDIDEVNALTDIPLIGGNTVEWEADDEDKKKDSEDDEPVIVFTTLESSIGAADFDEEFEFEVDGSTTSFSGMIQGCYSPCAILEGTLGVDDNILTITVNTSPLLEPDTCSTACASYSLDGTIENLSSGNYSIQIITGDEIVAEKIIEVARSTNENTIEEQQNEK